MEDLQGINELEVLPGGTVLANIFGTDKIIEFGLDDGLIRRKWDLSPIRMQEE